MDEEEIKKLIEKGESRNLEFKESLSLKNEIGESVSAFSNGCGGIILIGVSDLGKVSGLEIGKMTIESLANFIKQNTDNSVYSDILVARVEGKDIIVMKIKEQGEKPIFFRGDAYVRVGKSNHKLSASEIRKLAKEGSKSYWDGRICEDSKLSDFKENKIDWYLEQREKHRNISKEIRIPRNQFLENIKAVKNNKPTNAGILFFSSETLKFISQAQLRLVRINGVNVYDNILDRLDCSGTLWEMVRQAEEFLKKHINFMGFRTEKSFQREDRFDIPIESLRELIINALIHRDYETTADVRMFIFDDRIEIINPGHFPEGVTPRKPVHKPVNKVLSQYMYDIGLIEKYGSGIVMVRNSLKENGNKDLEYNFNEIETKTIVYSQVYGKDLKKDLEKDLESLTENQKIIIIEMKKNSKVTQEQLSKIININEKNIRNNISKLKEKSLLRRVGGAKGGYWEVVKEEYEKKK